MSPRFCRRALLCLLLVAALLLSVRSAPWVGLAFLGSLALFLGCGAALLPASITRGAGGPAEGVALLWGAGIAACYLLWTASAYAFGGVLPGALAALALAVFGLTRSGRLAPVAEGSRSPELVSVSALALVIGLYCVGVNGVLIGEDLLFTFRFDWAQHSVCSSLVREDGLPLPQGVGTYTAPGICHTGYFALAAGVDRLASIGSLQAMRLLHLQSFWLLALASYGLAAGLGAGRLGAALGALGALLAAGSLILEALFQGSLAPLITHDGQGLFQDLMQAGAFYYNGTQALAGALTAAALPVLGDSRPGGRGRFAIGCGFLVVAAQVKPSIFIIFGPALLMVLALSRSPCKLRWAAVIGSWLAVPALYALPLAFGARGSDDFSWQLRWSQLLKPSALNSMVMSLGAGLPIMGLALIGLARSSARERRWTAEQITGLALLGAVAFALLFVEVGRELHGNQFWPLRGAAVLFTPFVFARIDKALRAEDLSGPRRLGWRLAAVLAAQQILSGLCFAALYPFATPRRVPAAHAEVLEEARLLTSPEDRFLVTSELSTPPLAAYLGRPGLWSHWEAAQVCSDPQAMKRWQALERGAIEAPGPELQRYNSALIRDEALAAVLARDGWRRISSERLGRYQLWRRGPR